MGGGSLLKQETADFGCGFVGGFGNGLEFPFELLGFTDQFSIAKLGTQLDGGQ
jgi:hypothetical protein